MKEIRYISTATLDAIARNTLKQYHPDYLNQPPQATPIEQLVENVFGLRIEYMYLTKSGDELGRMIYDDGYTTRFNQETGNYELVEVATGTVLVDARLLSDPKLYGRFRFTLAHELGHWILHKEFFVGTNTAAATYGIDAADNSAIEWQANYLATALLMPAGQVKRSFYHLRMQTGGQADEVSTLASIFEVSKQAMEIRLRELRLI